MYIVRTIVCTCGVHDIHTLLMAGDKSLKAPYRNIIFVSSTVGIHVKTKRTVSEWTCEVEA